MKVDIGNSLDEVAARGISRDALDRLDSRVASIHGRIERGMEDREFGYDALNLPRSVDIDAIEIALEDFDDVESVLVIGIGGSALGAATLVSAIDGEAPVFVLDNIDPDYLDSVLGRVDLSRTVLHVASQSGKTMETLANFSVVRRAMTDAGVDWTTRTVISTGDSGTLVEIAIDNDVKTLAVPSTVPGRYSVISTVGLPVAKLIGLDCARVIDGAKDRMDRLTGSLFECPAYAYGATTFGLIQRGYLVNAMMPYAETLEVFAEWFSQLWAESLGKDGLGQTPVRALGATDQHSQLQLYRAGPSNTMVTFVHPKNRTSIPIPSLRTVHELLFEDVRLDMLLEAELHSTEASLAAASRPSIRIEIDRIDEFSIGGLLYDMQVATILTAELLDVNAFDQPAVEWGKQKTRNIISGDESIDGEKTSLVIE